jgi:hypothetical protein
MKGDKHRVTRGTWATRTAKYINLVAQYGHANMDMEIIMALMDVGVWCRG